MCVCPPRGAQGGKYRGSSALLRPADHTREGKELPRRSVTQHLLRAKPIKPSQPAEMELMFRCVNDAENLPRKGKDKQRSKWDIAADLYRAAFIANCAGDVETCQLIRGPTTPEMIKEWFEELAARHRTLQAEKAQAAAEGVEVAPSTHIWPPPPGPFVGDEVVTSGSAIADAVAKGSKKGVVEVEAKAVEVPVRASKGRKRWREQIERGKALEASDIPTLGVKACEEYLHAMGAGVKTGKFTHS